MTPYHPKTKRAAVLLTLLVLAAAGGAAGEKQEFYVNTYRSIGTVSPRDTRSRAMGGGGRGLADGVGSLGVNPAALGAYAGTGWTVGLGYDLLDDGHDDAEQTTFRLGGAVNLDRWHPHGGMNQAVGALVQSENYSGAADMGMKRNQLGALMSYGLQLSDDLLGGFSVALFDAKWKTSSTADTTTGGYHINRKYTGGEFRAGALYRLNHETTVGGTASYATGSAKEKTVNAGSGDFDRFGLGAGLARQWNEETLLLGDVWYDNMRTDISGVLKDENKAWGVSVGVERQVLPEVMALRGGLYYDRTSFSSSGTAKVVDSYSKGRFGITAGVGIKLYSFDLGYALDINSGGDVKNQLDLSAEW